ncbi:DUF4259 domain-containing protein [Aestuariivirga sp.]|uniref:DUF4259 domain-containing protein n=1 Tax=Aestuariivirga sp. TaxID=2650926 RepID=UPI0039E6B5FA
MGTWGSGSFENDDAADFTVEFESEGLLALHDALDIEDGDYLEAPVAQRAIAAAELVAMAERGDSEDDAISPELYDALQRHASEIIPALAELKELSLAALKKAEAENSELKQLWEEDDASEWMAAMAGLRQRLSRPTRRR